MLMPLTEAKWLSMVDTTKNRLLMLLYVFILSYIIILVWVGKKIYTLQMYARGR